MKTFLYRLQPARPVLRLLPEEAQVAVLLRVPGEVALAVHRQVPEVHRLQAQVLLHRVGGNNCTDEKTLADCAEECKDLTYIDGCAVCEEKTYCDAPKTLCRNGTCVCPEDTPSGADETTCACPDSLPYEDEAGNCVQCTTNEHCIDLIQTTDACYACSAGRCIPNNEMCPETMYCDENFACMCEEGYTPCNDQFCCASGEVCVDNKACCSSELPFIDANGNCVECKTDVDCEQGETCDLTSGKCVVGCTEDNDGSKCITENGESGLCLNGSCQTKTCVSGENLYVYYPNYFASGSEIDKGEPALGCCVNNPNQSWGVEDLNEEVDVKMFQLCCSASTPVYSVENFERGTGEKGYGCFAGKPEYVHCTSADNSIPTIKECIAAGDSVYAYSLNYCKNGYSAWSCETTPEGECTLIWNKHCL